MKNLVSHQTTKETVKVFYKVVMPSTYAEPSFSTLQEAINERNAIGTNGSHKTEDQIKYWQSVKDSSIIERVTQTSRRVV
jgi:hypothetical protein|tara:strand:- start:72 stop:311 length:240 start_codon:yes stop_codon:yes gene_type:complete